MMTIDAKTEADDTSVESTEVETTEVEATETVAELKTRLANVEKLNKKLANQKKEAVEAAAKAKKGIGEDGQDYKRLFEQNEAKAAKLVERMKRADVSSAATAQLTKIGVTADGMTAALKLMDINGVEWDEEDGVDATSVKAAVTSLRNEYPFLFERKVASTSVKVAKDGSTVNENEISRDDFSRLSAKEKASRMAKGTKIVD